MIKKSTILLPVFLIGSFLFLSSCTFFQDGNTNPPEDQTGIIEENGQQELTADEKTEEDSKEAQPLRLFFEDAVPDEVSRSLADHLLDELDFIITLREESDIVVSMGDYQDDHGNNYILSVVRPFFSFEEEITWDDFMAFWKGDIADIFNDPEKDDRSTMLLADEVFLMLEDILGECMTESIIIYEDPEDISRGLQALPNSFALVTFKDIRKEHKVIKIDGMSVMDKKLDLSEYPLAFGLVLEKRTSRQESDQPDILKDFFYSNREVDKMVTVNMTGVTALTRGTANRMDQNGLLYPAEEIGPLLQEADITHISNEVSFVEGCSGYKKGSLSFCSKPEYMELLKYVGTDIIELTGNHLNDYGNEWFLYTLDYYDEEDIPYFGGGRDLEEAHQPVTFELAGTKLAFIGANSFGPTSNWAQEQRAGSARINMWDEEQMEEDFLKISGLIKDLKEEGYTVIFTFQYMETYDYMPVGQQIIDFRRVIDFGADIVSGSQAHQPQGMEFYGEGFINYGLGNLFFDQMQSLGTRQGIIARHVFYEGKHINTILITTMLEDYCQPRLTTEQERIQLLDSLFAGSIY